VQAVLAEDTDVRFVFKDMPILSPQSQLAAHWSLAAHRQGKYFEFHQKVMTGSSINEDSMTAIATELGLDVEKMKKDAADPKIAQTVMQNIQVATDLGIRGTPAFIINDRVIGGYIELEEMKKVIAEVRAEAKGNDKDGKKEDKAKVEE
jgi:protein-disulfide isomerase